MWLELLRRAVEREGSSMAKVAQELEISRTAVSLVLSGQYKAKTDRIAARVLRTYGRVQCPYLGQEISNSQCYEHHSRPAPTSSPLAMRHWRACQNCPNRR